MFREMRRKKQEVSQEKCKQILITEKRGTLCVIGDSGCPYGIPMNFYYDETDEKIYFHCAKEGHKIDAIKRNNKVCFTTWNTGFKKEGDWAWNVTSVVVTGYAEFVSDSVLLKEKLHKLAEKYFPPEENIEEEIEKHADKVHMIALIPEHISGKLVNER